MVVKGTRQAAILGAVGSGRCDSASHNLCSRGDPLWRVAVLPAELLVALFDGASVGGAGGQVAQAAHLAAVVEGPGPVGEQCLKQLLEVVLLLVGDSEQCLFEHGPPGCGDLGCYCFPLFGQRDRGGAGVGVAAAAADKAALVEPVE